MNHRPFMLYGATDRANVLQYSREVVEAWRDHWCATQLAEIPVSVRHLESMEAPSGAWWCVGSPEEPIVAILPTARWDSGLPKLLFGEAIDGGESGLSGSLPDALLDELLGDLARRCVEDSAPARRAAPEACSAAFRKKISAPGSGYLVIDVALTDENGFRFLVSPDIVDRIITQVEHTVQRMPLTPANQALRRQQITADLVVGSGALTIEELRTLAIGDVIPLSQRLSDAVCVQVSGETAVRGHLGSRNGKIAVQISSH